MKINKQIFLLVAVVGTLSLLNVATARPSRDYTESSSDYSSSETSDDDTFDIADIPTDDYWARVKGDEFKLEGQVRTYYIAAEKRPWNYAPDGNNINDGTPYTPAEAAFVQSTATRIGSTYYKCLYTEYTNAKFNKVKQRTKEEEHLGVMGPVIRAEVGDLIKVVFINRCDFPTSIHPHAVFYDKESEGALYNDTTSGRKKQDDAVLPNHTYTYVWPVPERCGPNIMDGSSVMWMYHSHVDEITDFYAGLIGPIAITRKGHAKKDGRPKDVDCEFFYMYSVLNENNNPYLRDSFYEFSQALDTDPFPPADGGFAFSNQKFAINGYIFGNGPVPTMRKGDRCRWYMMSVGGAADGHTPHWHGNTCLVSGLRVDVVCTLAGEMLVADMCPDNVGLWEFHCHVNGHYTNGMTTRYEVLPPKKKDRDDYHLTKRH